MVTGARTPRQRQSPARAKSGGTRHKIGVGGVAAVLMLVLSVQQQQVAVSPQGMAGRARDR